jgi:DNA-binding NtrC family response regulator
LSTTAHAAVTVTAAAAPTAGGGPEVGDTEGEFLHLADLERRHLEQALVRAAGNKTAAAKLLGLSLRSLYTKLKRHGLAS